MSRHELARGNKSLWQRVEALVRSTLPRQARVTRTEGSTVWVRFVDEGSDAPDTKFPSTVSGVPVATMGWVFTLGGKKGLFVATGIPSPVSMATGVVQTVTASTSGTYEITTGRLVVGGLVPGKTRDVSVVVTQQAQGGGSGRFGYRITSNGETSTYRTQALDTLANTRLPYTFGYSSRETVGDDGEISVVPTITWSSGTVNINAAFITATVS